MPRFILIGLVEPPTPEKQAAFDEWFVGQHIEDTARCTNFVRGASYKLVGAHVGIPTPGPWISVYEVEAESYEEAERVLNEWQRNPNAWEGRAEHTATRERHGGNALKVLGSGWYELQSEFVHES